MAVPGEPPCRGEPGHTAAEDGHAGAQLAGGGGQGRAIPQAMAFDKAGLVHGKWNAQVFEAAAAGGAEGHASEGQKGSAAHGRVLSSRMRHQPDQAGYESVRSCGHVLFQ